LGKKLRRYAGQADVLVLGLPRGGVPVATEVARALRAPLDVFVVRKIGAPRQPELAVGAIATGGTLVLNEEIARQVGVDRETLQEEIARESRELERRNRLYRGGRPPPSIEGRTVILVDDGLATGATMRAAAAAIRLGRPARLVLAAPVGARDTCEEMRAYADDVVCAATPEPFLAVGLWYEKFPQTSDEEVREALARLPAGTEAHVSAENSCDGEDVGGRW
jgi:putative phosphoribosyl transferase